MRVLEARSSRLSGVGWKFFDVLPPEWDSDARAGAEVVRSAMADLERGALMSAVMASPCLHGGASS